MPGRHGRSTALNIDSHMHVNYKGLDAGGIVSYLDREGLDKCWLLTWEEVSPKAPVYSADEMIEAYRKYPERICPMYAPDPAAADAADKFMAWVDKGSRRTAPGSSTGRMHYGSRMEGEGFRNR